MSGIYMYSSAETEDIPSFDVVCRQSCPPMSTTSSLLHWIRNLLRLLEKSIYVDCMTFCSFAYSVKTMQEQSVHGLFLSDAKKFGGSLFGP